ncbi:MAG: hypothetical protein H6932_02085 [Burkholderiaceae bacterium]|nr:hypothetical protein [Burkholderiaceae bacterium]
MPNTANDDAECPTIHLALLDQPAWWSARHGRTHLPWRDALLLALLVLDGPRSRDSAATLLWPDATAAQRRANLRQRIKRLQDLSDQGLLALDGSLLSVGLNVIADTTRPDGEGTLLGTWLPEEEDAAAWLDAARLRLARRRADYLLAHARQQDESGNDADALETLARLVRADPLHEAAHTQLVALHYRRGELASAQGLYQRYARRLRRELDTEPGDDLQSIAALVDRARQDDRQRSMVWTSARRQATLLRPPRLLQRDDVWLVLEATRADGGLCVLLGAPGMGRSRIVTDVARTFGWTCHLRLRPADATTPGALLARWLQCGDPGQVLAMPPDKLVEACHSRAAQAGGILIDDLQAADVFSLERLPAVLRALPVPAVLAANLTSWPADWPDITHGPGVRVVTLTPWTESALEALADDLGVPADVDRSTWSRSLVAHSGGVPRATLATLAASGKGPPASGWRCPEIEVASWARWLERADPAVRALVELAIAADDEPGWGDALAETHPAVMPDQVKEARTVLRQAGGWAGSLISGRPCALLLSAAEGALSAETLRQLHRALAERGERRRQPAATVARHWTRAGEHWLAAQAHLRAAREATAHSLQQDAASHWIAAAAIWRSLHRHELALAADAAAAEMTLVGGNPALVLQTCDALTPQASTPREWAMLHRLRALALAYSACWAELLEASERARRAAQIAEESAWWADANLLWAYAAANLGRSGDALAALACDPSSSESDATPMAAPPEAPGPGGSPTLTPRMLWGEDARTARQRHQLAALVWQRLGRPEQALVRIEDGLASVERVDAQAERFILLSNSAAALNALDQRPLALQRARQGLAEATRLGQAHGMPGANLRMHVGMIAGSLGELGAAVEALDRAAADLSALGLGWMALIANHHLAQQWLTLGQAARALALVQNDPPDLPTSHRWRRWALRTELRALYGLGPAREPLPEDGAEVEPNVRALAALAQLHGLAADERFRRAKDLAQSLRRDGLTRTAFGAAARALAALAESAVSSDASMRLLAAELEAYVNAHDPDCAWQGEAWLALHQAWTAMGEQGRAAHIAGVAADWLTQTAQEHVPQAWRHGFLHQHRAHRELMRAARSADP